ncbi:hypothetical protein NPX13_g4219 [Xylaria arbuscula]|uniref:phospholipase A2 n=1 Tax=Xylaria arbuscula TaxID=114810 RepID=A0A9W8NFW6_9PEZI|nr:hypothetical protein NPX13_g4219 [Xylaria arbuscula]
MSAPQQLSLLSLDGGGVRGLSTLFILDEVMRSIDPDSPPKPCEYFDMIGGTSTGGLIAIMLGRLEMSVDECKKAYLAVMDKIFVKKHHRVTLPKLKVRGAFDTLALENAIKQVLKDRGMDEDSLLMYPEGKCKIFVTTTSKDVRGIRRLASYVSRGSGDILQHTKVWQAGRATSAAPSFFDPVVIGPYGEAFLDGGAGANNPIVELWNEARDVWSSEPLESQLRCLVSIGTGVPKAAAFGDYPKEILDTVLAIATDTEKTAQDFHTRHSALDSENIYFRFNVSTGLEDVGLEESKKRAVIAAATRSYVAQQNVQNQLLGSVYPLLTKNEKDCLMSLSFDYDERHDAIELPDSAKEGKSGWILVDPGFQQWEARQNLAHHNGIFFIEGHPGSGKSTIMKSLVTQFTADETKANEIILRFYFNARSGGDLERNPLGLFQALLHQLLLMSPPIPKSIFNCFMKRTETQENWSWKQNETIEFFFEALRRKNLKPVTIFIDALDECGTDGTTDEIRKIVELFETAVQDALKDGRILNLCVSSRHYPNIRFTKFNAVNVEDENQQDIGAYIEKWLPSTAKLSCPDSERLELKHKFIQKAGGVFLWVKLVMTKLKNLFSGGESITTLRDELEEVPSDLHNLYKKLVESLQVAKDRHNMLQILRWVLFSQQPLTAGELRHAMALAGTARSNTPPKELVETWKSESSRLTTNDRFADLVRTRSKGLVEIVRDLSKPDELDQGQSQQASDEDEDRDLVELGFDDEYPRGLSQSEDESQDGPREALLVRSRRDPQTNFWNRRVQVIHDSVRSFFVTELGLLLLNCDLKNPYLGLNHEHILEDSLKYLALYQVEKSIADLETIETLTSSIDLDALSDTSEDLQSPFREPAVLLNYAANYLFVHACEADRNGVVQKNLFDRLYTTQDGAFLKLILSLNQYHPLVLDSSYPWAINAPSVVLGLASFYMIEGCLQSLLNRDVGQGADVNALLDCRVDFRQTDQYTPLMIAVIAGHESIVKILLKFLVKAKADVDVRSGKMGRTALHLAAIWGRKNICSMLLKCKANAKSLDSQGKSPLYYACENRRLDVVMQLIKKGASIQTAEEQNSILQFLFTRYQMVDWTTVAPILNQLPDVNAQGEDGETPLSIAIHTGVEKLVEMMLKAGAELWGGTGVYTSPLYTASHNYSLVWLVKLMIKNDWGACYNLDKKDVAHGKTILHWAAEFGFTSLVEELISAKASVSIQDVYGETPLHYAAESGEMAAVKVLVNAGASLTTTDFECRNFRTPLDCARQRYRWEVAEYLSGLMEVTPSRPTAQSLSDDKTEDSDNQPGKPPSRKQNGSRHRRGQTCGGHPQRTKSRIDRITRRKHTAQDVIMPSWTSSPTSSLRPCADESVKKSGLARFSPISDGEKELHRSYAVMRLEEQGEDDYRHWM